MTRAPGDLLHVNDKLLHVRIGGTGSPTVLLEAGLGCGAETWCALFDDISRICTVVAYDRTGLMYSERGACRACLDTWLSDLKCILRHPAISKPIIFVGHSLGGVIARHYIANYPENIEGLILIETPDKEHIEILSQLRISLRIAKASGYIGVHHQWLFTALYRTFRPAFHALAEFRYRRYTKKHGRDIIDAVLHAPVRTMISTFDEAKQVISVISELPNLERIRNVELTVIAAESLRDKHPVRISGAPIPKRHGARHFRIQENIVKSFGKGRFVSARDCGHVVPLQRPDLVLREIVAQVTKYKNKLDPGEKQK